MEEKANNIFKKYNINNAFKINNSILESILNIIPNVPHTLLLEHYRCHPKIINYCNQKFYNNKLLIMTEDHGEKDVIKVIKTNKGDHARDKCNFREIQVIKDEILCNQKHLKDIGIIAPYNHQVNAIKSALKNDNLDISTVHKFQGREKDTIIISTVDNYIKEFVDDPNLTNVAISRAKKNIILVTSGNKQKQTGNIVDFINYIQYNNFEIKESKINSIFDYLYNQYKKEKENYLKTHKKISKYDSENLMYALLENIKKNNQEFSSLNIVCHTPLNILIKDYSMLDDKEYVYALNPSTHIDFLIYNIMNKKPLLAIEVDGYIFHEKNKIQKKRDNLKNNILKKYDIPLLRLSTIGYNEEEKIIKTLKFLIK